MAKYLTITVDGTEYEVSRDRRGLALIRQKGVGGWVSVLGSGGGHVSYEWVSSVATTEVRAQLVFYTFGERAGA